MAAPNNAPDWATAFAEFHARHRDVKGRKLVFTAIFNAAMEAFIGCDEVPLVWRVLAWIWRQSWGNDSDYCVDGIGGKPWGQQPCAGHFGVDKRRISDCVALLRELNFVLPPNGHKLYPVDDPAQAPQKDPNTTNVESPGPSGLFTQFCDEWKVRDLADFQELESHEAAVNRLKIVRLGKYKEWLRGRSNHAQPITANIQQVTAAPVPSSLSINPPSNGRTEEPAPLVETVRPSEWQDQKFRKGKLLAYLTQNFDRPTPPDDVVLNPLVSLISDEPLFLQFQKACRGFKPQNGWKGFLQIAKAVVANHGNYTQAKANAAAAVAPAEDRLMQMLRDRNESERKEREARAGR